MILCLDALVLLPALVQAGGEHEAVEVGAAHTVLVQRTQLNRAQIQAVLEIRFHMFLGLPDLDLDRLVRGTESYPNQDLAPPPLPFSHKYVERSEIMVAKSNFNPTF
jgi:hypothetical protein